ncbi:MAG: hypothetical protein P8J50_13190 [Acidimicrobiales bacterium]|nr:hypothetical protein [Acidimicrobiales bacterium]
MLNVGDSVDTEIVTEIVTGTIVELHSVRAEIETAAASSSPTPASLTPSSASPAPTTDLV